MYVLSDGLNMSYCAFLFELLLLLLLLLFFFGGGGAQKSPVILIEYEMVFSIN